MNEVQTIKVKGIARHMQQLKAEGRSTALLVGAGISASAGIPMAGAIAEELRNDPRYNYRFEDIVFKEGDNEYNIMMKALTYKQREEYLRGYIDKAKINLSHLIIGMLIKEGYVSSVLTTNFDPLLVKTMALFNHHTYVYDLANIREYVSDSVMSPNIFYLHGQGHAFLMLNTREELSRPKQYFQTLINDMMHKHYFLVVGYSGLTDFIFNTFCSFPRFPSDLHWVGYKSETPPKHVMEQLCNKDSVRYINSNGSDSFFRDLANELKLSYAPFLDNPFEYLKEMLGGIGKLEYDNGREPQIYDIIRQPLLKINTAIQIIEEGVSHNINHSLAQIDIGEYEAVLAALNYRGNYEEVINLEKEILDTNVEGPIKELSKAYRCMADKYYRKDDLEKVNEMYAKAAALNKEPNLVWVGWGTDLVVMAKSRDDDSLYAAAFEKFAVAVKQQSNLQISYFNWALGLYFLYLKTQKRDYLQQAIEKAHAANGHIPHFSDFNLACYYQLLGDSEKALLMLESSIKNPVQTSPQNREEVESDEHFKDLKGTPAFEEILNKYYPDTATA